MKTVASRPNYSDVEKPRENYEQLCSTCWEVVMQPFIKGLWYHSDKWILERTRCTKLVPIPYGEFRETKYTCLHDFKVIPELAGAVKCSKCGYPYRVDLFEIQDYIRVVGYFCNDCKKPFKILSKHALKYHKDKPFAFKEVQ
ncbi:MAG: hypothetical protein KGI08_11075 [Thaumarchaeota archaeon]|nr:hypothetical protein [Nitrososphaerota archaeon]